MVASSLRNKRSVREGERAKSGLAKVGATARFGERHLYSQARFLLPNSNAFTERTKIYLCHDFLGGLHFCSLEGIALKGFFLLKHDCSAQKVPNYPEALHV